jgi:hypothetical protein
MLENLTLNVVQEVYVAAGIQATFSALLAQLGPHNDLPDGNPMPMKLEAWPGGRWYRDLGSENGDVWGNVRAINRPTILEITGQLFMDFSLSSQVTYRLKAVEQQTVVSFRYVRYGLIQNDERAKIEKQWTRLNLNIRMWAETHPFPVARASDARPFR